MESETLHDIALAVENRQLRAHNAALTECLDSLTQICFQLCRKHGDPEMAGLFDRLSSEIETYRMQTHG